MISKHETLVRRPRTDEDGEYPEKSHPSGKQFDRMMTILKELKRESEPETDPHVRLIHYQTELRKVKTRLARLESILVERPGNRGDEVYEAYREDLEKKHFDKVVAIDTEQKEIVGVGRTVEEAYQQARSKRSNKRQFYFRRVGKSFVERVG